MKKNYTLILMCLVSALALSQTTSTFDFNTPGQLSSEFTQGGASALISQTTNTGIGSSGAVNVSGNTNEVFTTKQGYSNSGEGAVFTFQTYFKSEFNSGYGGVGFTSNPNATHWNYAAPNDGLGISVHGGGYIFTSGTNTQSGNWDGGDVLNNASADDWYLAVLTIELKANSYYDMTIEIYPSDANGVVGPTPTETKTWNVQNTNMANSTVIYSYFAFGGHRITNFDNYTINLQGSTIIEAGAPVVIGDATYNSGNGEIDLTGEITDDRGAAVTERGFVYSTSNNPPTIADTKIIVGSGLGVFSSQLGSLSSNTTYYVRAYGINSEGVSYGNLKEFDTSVLSSLDFIEKNNLKVYPNPSKNFISVSGLSKVEKYSIYNVLGRKVLEGNVHYKEKINTSTLAKGVYLFKLDSNVVVKFIKN